MSALTLEQARQAVAACTPEERAVLAELTPHEVALCLEAKVYAGARIVDGLTARSVAEDAARDAAREARAKFAALFEREETAA